jgi:hypothetical protein
LAPPSWLLPGKPPPRLPLSLGPLPLPSFEVPLPRGPALLPPAAVLPPPIAGPPAVLPGLPSVLPSPLAVPPAVVLPPVELGLLAAGPLLACAGLAALLAPRLLDPELRPPLSGDQDAGRFASVWVTIRARK